MPILSYFDQVLITANRYLVGQEHPASAQGESLVENQHLGWLIIADPQGRLLHSTPGASEISTFFRSSAKPFQALPLVTKGYSCHLTTEELAITCASHTGSARHMGLSASILKKAGLSDSALQCGPHWPADSDEVALLRSTNREPCRLHNNCSGKHAGMLFYCQQAGLPIDTYLEPNHPLQAAIWDGLRALGGIEQIPLAIDGCGAPVFYLPLAIMARLYAHLGSNPDLSPLREAMTMHPELVGGQGRVDTVIMQASRGKLLAKVGADGVLCVAHCDLGQGLALKISDGSGEVRDLALVEILIRLGWLDSDATQNTGLIRYIEKKTRTNTQGKAVGQFQVHFNPGD